ncbi:MAG: hypothetical protein WCN95_07650 [bacterium]
MTPFLITRLFLKLAVILLLSAVVVGVFFRFFKGRQPVTTPCPTRTNFQRISRATALVLIILSAISTAFWFYVSGQSKPPVAACACTNTMMSAYANQGTPAVGTELENSRRERVTACAIHKTNSKSEVPPSPSSRWPSRWVLMGIASIIVLMLVALSKAIFHRIDPD